MMTVDKFFREFDRCPSCKSTSLHPTFDYVIMCECDMFVAYQPLKDKTMIDSIRLYVDEVCYEFENNKLSVLLKDEFGNYGYNPTHSTDCSEEMMLKMLRKPSLIDKYLMLS